MCAILGSITKKDIDIKSMSQIMAHRGPDDEGFYYKKYDNFIVNLAHRRLSIIDLSPAGHQPMEMKISNSKSQIPIRQLADRSQRADRDIWIVFNGEIYNFQELRKELEEKGYQFKSKTDTEVILASYIEWGIDCLNKLNGMFAFAIWDENKQQLFIARDRFGIKPLYYTNTNNNFIFASELKAILKSGLIQKEINLNALASYLMFGSVLPPQTIVRDIFCLLPGHYIIYKNNNLEIKEYYNILESRIKNQELKEKNIIEKTENLLEKGIKNQLVADVPVGIFLSGGIDSSSIVSVASRFSSKLKTISIGFNEKEFNETHYADIIAKIFNTDHYNLIISPQNVLNEMPKIIKAMDQPSIDGINTYFISKAARQFGLKVALSGLGGDEVFCGYNYYRKLPKIYRLTKLWFILNSNFRKKLIKLIFKKSDLKNQKIKEYFISNGEYLDLYLLSRSLFPNIFIQKIMDNTVIAGFKNEYIGKLAANVKNLDIINAISYFDLKLYMHHTLLRDTDFMSMAHSLEVRVPLLDENLAEYIFNLSGKSKIKKLNKWLLTRASGLFEKVPEDLYKRHKVGFSFPLEKWLKNELKEIVSTAIENIKKRSWLNKKEIENLRQLYLNNNIFWSRVWALVVLELWLKEYLD